jgi:hypothetical protein
VIVEDVVRVIEQERPHVVLGIHQDVTYFLTVYDFVSGQSSILDGVHVPLLLRPVKLLSLGRFTLHSN